MDAQGCIPIVSVSIEYIKNTRFNR